MTEELDAIWKALADATRRQILDFLRNGPRTTTEIVEQFPHLSRFGVMKHLDVLREADLVKTRCDGRRRVNTINAVPIRRIYERWVSKYEDVWASSLVGLKDELEPQEPPVKEN
jgi:DNA-binding transcriptional ArsR family regulator